MRECQIEIEIQTNRKKWRRIIKFKYWVYVLINIFFFNFLPQKKNSGFEFIYLLYKICLYIKSKKKLNYTHVYIYLFNVGVLNFEMFWNSKKIKHLVALKSRSFSVILNKNFVRKLKKYIHLE